MSLRGRKKGQSLLGKLRGAEEFGLRLRPAAIFSNGRVVCLRQATLTADDAPVTSNTASVDTPSE